MTFADQVADHLPSEPPMSHEIALVIAREFDAAEGGALPLSSAGLADASSVSEASAWLVLKRLVRIGWMEISCYAAGADPDIYRWVGPDGDQARTTTLQQQNGTQ